MMKKLIALLSCLVLLSGCLEKLLPADQRNHKPAEEKPSLPEKLVIPAEWERCYNGLVVIFYADNFMYKMAPNKNTPSRASYVHCDN